MTEKKNSLSPKYINNSRNNEGTDREEPAKGVKIILDAYVTQGGSFKMRAHQGMAQQQLPSDPPEGSNHFIGSIKVNTSGGGAQPVATRSRNPYANLAQSSSSIVTKQKEFSKALTQ